MLFRSSQASNAMRSIEECKASSPSAARKYSLLREMKPYILRSTSLRYSPGFDRYFCSLKPLVCYSDDLKRSLGIEKSSA